ncbi:hypothetical protein NUU61_001260 [Penicillium alfredii]|uniref:DUF7923 domain-containing protein n=1 Tax=Penicillium alfredii TaxID=1506179 RepID=A0A9W9KRT1_9EURO|nr:uncharacterized protein NUU61_001260 [Penicillium alfredii]KAJ5115501.1 hypothetical protein NUU61_001260 [Penicillium alfredii]
MLSVSTSRLNPFLANALEQKGGPERSNNTALELVDQIKILHMELAHEKSSRLKYLEEVFALQEQTRALQETMNKNPFVAVVVDGDGAKFLDSLLRHPREGAKQAALNLKQAVKEYLKGTVLESDEVPIVVRIFANIDDLGRSLYLSGVVNSRDDMRTFSEHFTNNSAEFDFVNVGRGKENADFKVKTPPLEMFDHYYRNFQCKKIFFAGCHDNGYIHELRDYGESQEAQQRIVLLETTPAESSFEALGFPITSFDAVFRREPLENEFKAKPIQMRAQSCSLSPSSRDPLPTESKEHREKLLLGSSITPSLKTSISRPKFSLAAKPQNSNYAAIAHMESIAQGPSGVNINDSGRGGITVTHSTASYATVARTENVGNLTLERSKFAKPNVIEYNSDGQRLDPEVKPPSDSQAWESYKLKQESALSNTFCNDHYLGGSCTRPNCNREHGLKLTPSDLVIQRYYARKTISAHMGYLVVSLPGANLVLTYPGAKWKLRDERWTEGKTFPERFLEHFKL